MSDQKLYVVDKIVKANVQLLSNHHINKAGYIFREATDKEIRALGWIRNPL
jgi:hypothetical protein